MNKGGVRRKFTGFWQFIVVGTITFAIVGYLFISFVEPAIINFVLEQQKLNPVVFANRLASEYLSADDFALPITDEKTEHFINFANHLQITGLVRLEIWNRDGIIVYSDKNDLIGRQFPLDDALKKAFDLNAVAEIRAFDDSDPHFEHGVQFGEGLIVNAPITFGSSPRAVGAIVIHSRAGFLRQEIDKIERTIVERVVISLLLIFVTLSFIVLRESRTVAIQQKHLQEAAERQVKHAEELTRAKDEFVALASHQLRTPPSIINWYVEMLISGEVGEMNEKQRQYVKEIYAANQRMVKLVNDFLNISRIESGRFAVDPEPTNLKDIAYSIITEFTKPIKEKELNVEIHCDEDLPPINVDQKFMVIILENLISNAIKYTPAKGKVDVVIRKEEYNVVLEIKDTGYGIPRKDYDKIFTKLFRASNIESKVSEGTGLGLYLVKIVLEQSGGAIRFESEENKGTTFYVSLPLSGMKKKAGTVNLTA